MYTSLCIARVFDDHRSCQKLINYITNIKAKSKRYHSIQKIPVLKWLFIQNFCKRSRCLEENPVLLFLSQKFNAAVHRLHDQKIRIILINFRFQIGNDRQSKRLHVLANLGRIIFFHFFFGIKTGVQDFLLDIYFAYKSFVLTATLVLEFS
jgi:hypothetical protein